MSSDKIIVTVFLFLGFLCLQQVGYAQIFSPGKLSEAHKKLEGVTNCTSCHTLGKKGIDNIRCLNCHTPLKANIEQQLGYHATVIDQNCANCHKEHLGRNFKIVRWDTALFNHKETSFALVGKHYDLACKSCHDPKFITNKSVIKFKSEHNALEHTFLGLATKCVTCHESDSPHGQQFLDQDCQSCHTAYDWKDLASFDHSDTRFDLVGQHMKVSCSSCHGSVTTVGNQQMVKYTGLEFGTCRDCHEDPHDGQMGTTCANCHSAQGWNKLISFSEQGFDHSTTGFPLMGKHQTVKCASCHNPRQLPTGISIQFVQSTLGFSYPHPKTGKCISCHEDYHDGAFRASSGGTDCQNCHTEDGWLPTTFGTQRHNLEAQFALTGAHLAIPCGQCHQPANSSKMKFHFSDSACETCHEKDNPHEDEFQNAAGKTVCADCHVTDSWTAEISFDHSKTKFPLTGAHMVISCESCHNTEMAIGSSTLKLPLDCAGCHKKDDPHQGQFAKSSIGSNCDACHATQSFTMQAFDHSRTRFPLDGAHENVACASCHNTEKTDDGTSFVRFRPLQTTCESCHGSNK